MQDEFSPLTDARRNPSGAEAGAGAPRKEAVHPTTNLAPPRHDLPTEPPPIHRWIHPLERPDDEERNRAADAARIRLAWTKLVWLLAMLALLLTVSYMVPFIAEQTQYAITRGKQRAEHDIAAQHIGESPLADLSRAYQMVSQVVGPSVVHINTQGSPSEIRPLSMRGRPRMPSEGQGSGVIVEKSGYILTNYHVIRDSKDIDVSLSDGQKVRARVIGYDAANDLAVLKIKAENLTPVNWGDSEKIEAGALVWAVGSPFGLERTITSGILSAKHRAGLAGSLHQDFLQTDAAVNPGNSGGPLVDSQGRVIGINTAIVGDAFQGISFAIPSKVARAVYERVKTEGTVKRGWLGVALVEVTSDVAAQVGLPSPTGIYIANVVDQKGGSPAAHAGIRAGDVIVKWNDTIVRMPVDLMRLVGETAIGSRAKVTVFRAGQELTLEVVVGERPDDA
jgi:S1-C subfamily serine protease